MKLVKLIVIGGILFYSKLVLAETLPDGCGYFNEKLVCPQFKGTVVESNVPKSSASNKTYKTQKTVVKEQRVVINNYANSSRSSLCEHAKEQVEYWQSVMRAGYKASQYNRLQGKVNHWKEEQKEYCY